MKKDQRIFAFFITTGTKFSSLKDPLTLTALSYASDAWKRRWYASATPALVNAGTVEYEEALSKAVDKAVDKAGQQIEKAGDRIQDAAKGDKK